MGMEVGCVYPTVTDCPLCGKSGKLEVRTTNHIYCHMCHFSGDMLSLLAHKRGEPVSATLEDLAARGLISSDSGSQLSFSNYLKDYNRQALLKAVLRDNSYKMRMGTGGALSAILGILGIRYPEQVLLRLIPHICVLRKSDFVDNKIPLPKSAKETLGWWGRYTALAIPSWCGADIAGFWLVTIKGSAYLPLSDEHQYSNAFGCLPSVTDDVVFVVDDIIAALRCTIWSVLESSKPVGFIVPYGASDNAETYQCGRVVFWSPTNNGRWYLRAMKTPAALTLDSKEIVMPSDSFAFPCNGNFNQFRLRAINSTPAHQAAVYYLLSLKNDEAGGMITGSGVDPVDKAKMMSYVHGDDASHIAELFEKTIENQAITWNGAIITDSPTGWLSKSKLISSVKMVIEQIRPMTDCNDAVIVGHLVYDRKSFRFSEKFSDIQRNTADWMQQHIVKHAGVIPYVDRSWSGKLIEIAQQFHVPTPVLSDKRYGWNESGSVLLLPYFAVDQNGVHPTSSSVDGPRIVLPAQLSKAEWQAFNNRGFCRIVLAMMGNMVRTNRGNPAVGLMFTNEPHVVSRLASAFGSEVIVNPTLDIVESSALLPLPLFTEWKEFKLKSLFIDRGYKNVVFSTDSHSAKLSLINPDWLQVKTGGATDYSALRVIFHLLPRVLRSQTLDINSDTFYRDLAQIISLDVAEQTFTSILSSIAIELDHHSSYRASTAASRILELIYYSANRGDLIPRIEDEWVAVSKQQFLTSMANPLIPIPTLNELTDRLSESRFLVRNPKGKSDERVATHWFIDRGVWDMSISLINTAVPVY